MLFDLLRKLPRTMNLENNKGIEDRHISYLESLVLGVIEKIAKSTKVSAKVSIPFFSCSLTVNYICYLNSYASYG